MTTGVLLDNDSDDKMADTVNYINNNQTNSLQIISTNHHNTIFHCHHNNNAVTANNDMVNGRLVFTSAYNQQTEQYDTYISTIYSTYPVKLFPLTSKHIHTIHKPGNSNNRMRCKSQLCYIITYGGGVLANDSINLSIQLQSNTTAVLTTQTSTKLYKSLSNVQYCVQCMNVVMECNSTLYLTPDPITPYRDSRYIQKQCFHLTDLSCNLLLIDSYTSGRYGDTDRKERWSMHSYMSMNQIYLNNQVLIHDTVKLDNTTNMLSIQSRMAQYNIVCMCILIGNKLKPLANYIHSTVQSKHINYDHRRHILSGIDPNCIISTSPLYIDINNINKNTIGTSDIIDGVVIRIVSINTQLVNQQLRWMFQSIEHELIAPPWNR